MIFLSALGVACGRAIIHQSGGKSYINKLDKAPVLVALSSLTSGYEGYIDKEGEYDLAGKR